MIIVLFVLLVAPGVISASLHRKLDRKEKEKKNYFFTWLVYSFFILAIGFAFMYYTRATDGFIGRLNTFIGIVDKFTMSRAFVTFAANEGVALLSDALMLVLRLLSRWCAVSFVASVLLPFLARVLKIFYNGISKRIGEWVNKKTK